MVAAPPSSSPHREGEQQEQRGGMDPETARKRQALLARLAVAQQAKLLAVAQPQPEPQPQQPKPQEEQAAASGGIGGVVVGCADPKNQTIYVFTGTPLLDGGSGGGLQVSNTNNKNAAAKQRHRKQQQPQQTNKTAAPKKATVVFRMDEDTGMMVEVTVRNKERENMSKRLSTLINKHTSWDSVRGQNTITVPELNGKVANNLCDKATLLELFAARHHRKLWLGIPYFVVLQGKEEESFTTQGIVLKPATKGKSYGTDIEDEATDIGEEGEQEEEEGPGADDEDKICQTLALEVAPKTPKKQVPKNNKRKDMRQEATLVDVLLLRDGDAVGDGFAVATSRQE